MAPPHAMSTAVPTKTPAPIAPAARVASGIALPHALQPGQQQQSSHPYVTARHDAEHGKQEGLTSEGVISVEVRRAQRGKDDEKYDRERHDDRRGRARLHLKSARLALDLLGAADRDFESAKSGASSPPLGLCMRTAAASKSNSGSPTRCRAAF